MKIPQIPDFELANAIRDTTLSAVKIAYDWKKGVHVLTLQVIDPRRRDDLRSFQVTGLSLIDISEDFSQLSHIAFCTVLRSPNRVYLSLSPHDEFVESDQDNYSFVGHDMAEIIDEHGSRFAENDDHL